MLGIIRPGQTTIDKIYADLIDDYELNLGCRLMSAKLYRLLVLVRRE